jgi:lambda family phage tail tape measure protein
MAKAISTLSIKVDFKDTGAQAVIDKIGGSIKRLQVISGPTSQTIQKLRQQVTQLGQKGNNSISTIEGQIGALRGLRREADLNSKEFKELTGDIEKYTQKLQKAQGQKKRGGLGARGATQVAGAVISGGIFGGPEGALGALGGAALGGVQGAFTGAAIGAQLKGLRELMAGAGEYSAKIEKLKIALQGVTSSQSEFNFATAAARQATEELNIPQAQSIAGITRLAAAVKGAGGPLTDATLTFKNVTAAIKATGGSSEDVKGAITAMVQVFSKGKVSAEELSGQLGERLPGAVTMFAKANKMTLPELQKNLKAGTVGLDELMNFIVELGSTYGGTAKKISDSNADAGARLQVQIQDLQAAVGEGLVPIGAQFQDAFGRFIEDITPTLADVLPKIAQLFLNIAKNLGKVLEVALVVLATVTVGKITAIMSSVGGLAGAMAKLSKAAGTARAALIGLNATALVNPYTALAAGVTVLLIQLNKANRAQAQLNALISSGGVAQVDAEIAKLGGTKEYDLARDRMLQNEDKKTVYNIRGEGFGLPGQFSRAKDKKLVDTIDRLRARREVALYDARQGAALPDELLARFRLKSEEGYDDPTTEDKGKGGGKGKGPKDISSLQMEARLSSIIAGRNKATVEERRKALMLQREAAVRASEELTPNKQLVAILQASEKFRKGNLEIDKQITAEAEKQAQEARKLADARMQLKDQIGLLTPEERVKAAQESFKSQFKGATDEDLGLIRQAFNPTDFERMQQGIRSLNKELKELVNPANMIINAANAIGDAFTDSFMSVITGSATTQEALSSFFKNVGKFFLDMAAQIIQKMITMFILNKVVGLLPGGFNSSTTKLGAGGGQVGGIGTLGPNFGIRQSAKGSYFENGIARFARGGIVNSPTFFPYSDGGTGRFGLMGEAGPEAIMPLQRGSDGKLGVSVTGNMRAAMARYKGTGTTGSASRASESGFSEDGSVALGGAIDVRYNVERINSVDYVTADQFQAGMREAATQGAKQGEQRALTTLRQNTTQRKRVGLQ